jgi:ABC-type lipoprotein export system ATPase subunit
MTDIMILKLLRKLNDEIVEIRYYDVTLLSKKSLTQVQDESWKYLLQEMNLH